MRPLVLRLAVFVGAVSVLAACGGDDGGLQKLRTVSNPADQARAEAFALTVVDLPSGWRGTGSGPVVAETCDEVDFSGLVARGTEVRDFTVESGTVVTSTAIVFSIPSDAQAAFERYARPEIAACLVEVTSENEKPRTTIRKLALPRLGAQTAGYEIGFDLPTSIADVRTPSYVSHIFIRQARGLAHLVFLEIGSSFDRSLRRHLAEVVAERLRLTFA